MKYKTTQKEINATFKTRIEVPDGSLQHLLCYETPFAYTANREGWAADIYDFGTVAIVTGRSPFGNKKPSYELRREFDISAEKLFGESEFRALSFQEQKEKLHEMTRAFIEKVIA